MVSTTQSVFLTRRTSCTKELKFARLRYSRKIAQVKNGKEKAKENELQVEKNISGKLSGSAKEDVFWDEESLFLEA